MRISRALLVTSVSAALVVGVAPVASAKPGDKAIAKKALLEKVDLRGSGWTSQERDPEAEAKGNANRRGIPECADVQDVIDSSKKYRNPGPSFRKRASTGTQGVDDTVYVFPDAKAARRYMAPFIADDGVRCFRKALAKLLQDAAPDGTEVLTQARERAPKLGDSSIRYEMVGTLTDAQGNEEKVYIDVVAVQVGRGLTGLTFQSEKVKLPAEDDITETATKKLEQAL